jgi:peptidoglycan/LPS O-acetylase OafA/YrhL
MNDHHASLFFTFTNTDALALGALLAIMEYNGMLKRYQKIASVIFVVSGILVSTLYFLYPLSVAPLMINIQPLCVNLFYFSFIWKLILTKNGSSPDKIFSNKILGFCGLVSYGLYVYHPFCFFVVKKYINHHHVNTVLFVLLSFALTFVMSIASYYCFEKWFIRLKWYFQTSVSQKK